MTATQAAREPIAHAGTAILQALCDRRTATSKRTVISDNLAELRAELGGLGNHDDSRIKQAIRALHHVGAIDCGRPKLEEFTELPEEGQRGYKITLLIQP